MLANSFGSAERMDLDRVLRVWGDEMTRGMSRPAVELVQMLALADFRAKIDPNAPRPVVAVWGDRLSRVGNAGATAQDALADVQGVAVRQTGTEDDEIRIEFFDA